VGSSCSGAYIAECQRGLQVITRGQYEARGIPWLELCSKDASGDSSPGLKIVFRDGRNPDSAFKDTSLVVIIALYDLLKTDPSALSNPTWMGFSPEAYIFVA